MTWVQVADDFVKFGLAPLCTAAVALLAAKFLRSHDLEKERRRRKQDFIENVGRLLDDLIYRTAVLHISSEHAKLSDPQAQTTITYYKDKAICENAYISFNNLRSQFLMSGFTDCVQGYGRILREAEEVFGQFYEWENHRPAKIQPALEKFESEVDDFRLALAEAYRTL